MIRRPPRYTLHVTLCPISTLFRSAQVVVLASGPRLFQVGAEGVVSHPGTAVELVVFKLREHPEPLGVAFEIEKVVALGFAHGVKPTAACGLLEPIADGILAGMAE